jgi:hypothetical protein
MSCCCLAKRNEEGKATGADGLGGGSSGNHRLEVSRGIGSWMKLKFLDQNIQDRGGEEGGEVGAEVNILDPEMKKSQENRDSFLFKPRDSKVKRQSIDVSLQDISQG